MTRQDLRNRRPRFTCGANLPNTQHGRIDGLCILAAAALTVLSIVALSILFGAA